MRSYQLSQKTVGGLASHCEEAKLTVRRDPAKQSMVARALDCFATLSMTGFRNSRSVFRDHRGVAALEFGLIASVLVTLFLGTFDLGNAAQQRIKLQQAVRAGGQYAMAFPDNLSGITTTIQNALPASWTNVTIATPVTSCSCYNSSTGATTASGSCSCPQGQALERFMTLSVSRPYTPIFLSSLTTSTASYVARYQ